ncbi:MAG: hypothetical protein HDT43_01810 [Ruminococcaceae bacterium]|nr:hypothetical protein [Oscillospiraceae bacterium]
MLNTNELTAKVKQIRELKRMQEEIAAEIETLTDAVKAEMTERNTSEMVVDCFKVRWTPVTSSRLDTTALKRELPEIAEHYTKVSESKRFTIN